MLKCRVDRSNASAFSGATLNKLVQDSYFSVWLAFRQLLVATYSNGVFPLPLETIAPPYRLLDILGIQ